MRFILFVIFTGAFLSGIAVLLVVDVLVGGMALVTVRLFLPA